MKRINEPFQILSEAVDSGLEHVAICLDISPRPKAANKEQQDVDVEARGDALRPGDAGFSRIINEKLDKFNALKEETLRELAKQRKPGQKAVASLEEAEMDYDHAQLYILLYIERLMHAAGEAVQDFVAFADKKVHDGTMSQNELIFPSQRRLRKWMMSVFQEETQPPSNPPKDSRQAATWSTWAMDTVERKIRNTSLPPMPGSISAMVCGGLPPSSRPRNHPLAFELPVRP